MNKSKTFFAIPPGMTIREMLSDRGMSQKEFAVRMDMSEKHISKLVNGEVILTPDMAVRLEFVLGAPAQFWNNLESDYREKLIKVKYENDMDEDVKVARQIPYAEMVKKGWLPAVRTWHEKVTELRKFFEVVSLNLLPALSQTGITDRLLNETERSRFAVLAWLQRVRLEARRKSVGSFSISKLNDELPAFRRMTMQDPIDFCPALESRLAACGIAIVFLEHLSGSYLQGVSFRDGKKVIIGVTVRGKDADRFWFSLFHEFGHILAGHLHGQEQKATEQEHDADDVARNLLIPDEAYSAFVRAGHYSSEAVRKFASSVGIAAGIVVGRLQKEEIVPYTKLNGLKVKYAMCS